MRLNLDKSLIDLRGNPQKENLSDILADILATSSTHRPAQTIAWAYDLVKTGEIEVSRTDLEFIKSIISRNPNFTDLAKAQLLEEIDKLLKE